MKLTKLRSMSLLSLAALLLFATSLDAQMRGRDSERGFRGDGPRRAEIHNELNLTEEQETKLTALRTEHQKAMIDKRAALQKARLDIRTEMVKDQPDMQAIERMIKNRETLRSEMQLNQVKHWNEIREILTPEQREIWNQHKRSFGERGARWDGRRGGRDFQHRRR
jgi:Spy/CpxP family protein refolding chaperone